MTALHWQVSCAGSLEKGISKTLQLGENSLLGGYAVSGGLPGFTLFLMEQPIYMEWEQLQFLRSKPLTCIAV